MYVILLVSYQVILSIRSMCLDFIYRISVLLLQKTLTFPTPVLPVKSTERCTDSNSSIRQLQQTVLVVGTSISKKGCSLLYLNEGSMVSHGKRHFWVKFMYTFHSVPYLGSYMMQRNTYQTTHMMKKIQIQYHDFNKNTLTLFATKTSSFLHLLSAPSFF